MRKFLLLAVIAFVASAIAIAKQSITTKLPDGWKQLDADHFTVYAPASWHFIKMQGIDSYVGAFVGDGARLEFDYGH